MIPNNSINCNFFWFRQNLVKNVKSKNVTTVVVNGLNALKNIFPLPEIPNIQSSCAHFTVKIFNSCDKFVFNAHIF